MWPVGALQVPHIPQVEDQPVWVGQEEIQSVKGWSIVRSLSLSLWRESGHSETSELLCGADKTKHRPFLLYLSLLTGSDSHPPASCFLTFPFVTE